MARRICKNRIARKSKIVPLTVLTPPKVHCRGSCTLFLEDGRLEREKNLTILFWLKIDYTNNMPLFLSYSIFCHYMAFIIFLLALQTYLPVQIFTHCYFHLNFKYLRTSYMVVCYILLRRWNTKLDLLRIPTAHLNCNLHFLLCFEQSNQLISNYVRRRYGLMLSRVNQGPLITNGQNSYKWTGHYVGWSNTLQMVKMFEKYFQMDNFIDRRCYKSHFCIRLLLHH